MYSLPNKHGSNNSFIEKIEKHCSYVLVISFRKKDNFMAAIFLGMVQWLISPGCYANHNSRNALSNHFPWGTCTQCPFIPN